MRKLIIQEAENGFIITLLPVTDDDLIVNEIIENEGTDKEAMTKLLTKIAEHFGESYNKYSKENINITWDKKGHKVED